MITKGQIVRLNTAEDNHFLVYVPLLQKASDRKEDATLSATLSTIKGIEKAFSIGDIVYIDFEDNNYNKPVILGHLYLGSQDSKSLETSLSLQSLIVTGDTILKNNANVVGYDFNKMKRDIEKLIDNYRDPVYIVDLR